MHDAVPRHCMTLPMSVLPWGYPLLSHRSTSSVSHTYGLEIIGPDLPLVERCSALVTSSRALVSSSAPSVGALSLHSALAWLIIVSLMPSAPAVPARRMSCPTVAFGMASCLVWVHSVSRSASRHARRVHLSSMPHATALSLGPRRASAARSGLLCDVCVTL